MAKDIAKMVTPKIDRTPRIYTDPTVKPKPAKITGKGVVSKVSRIYPDSAGCYVRLSEPQYEPKDGYFWLDLKHPNYNSLYSLAVVAAVNGYDLAIVTLADIVDTAIAQVDYMYLDW